MTFQERAETMLADITAPLGRKTSVTISLAVPLLLYWAVGIAGAALLVRGFQLLHLFDIVPAIVLFLSIHRFHPSLRVVRCLPVSLSTILSFLVVWTTLGYAFVAAIWVLTLTALGGLDALSLKKSMS